MLSFSTIFTSNILTESAPDPKTITYLDIETLHEAELDILRNILDTQTQNDVNKFLGEDFY